MPTEKLYTEEELSTFADRMREYAIEQGINEAVYEAVISYVVRQDNAILFHRSFKNWIDRHLPQMEPTTKWPMFK